DRSVSCRRVQVRQRDRHKRKNVAPVLVRSFAAKPAPFQARLRGRPPKAKAAVVLERAIGLPSLFRPQSVPCPRVREKEWPRDYRCRSENLPAVGLIAPARRSKACPKFLRALRLRCRPVQNRRSWPRVHRRKACWRALRHIFNATKRSSTVSRAL